MLPRVLPPAETCFFEQDPGSALLRRATVEGVGTLLLMLAATGSGLAIRQLLPGGGILGVLASAVATAGALAGLIVAFGAASGGHFNPLITVLQWLGGERARICTLAYVGAQFAGAFAGALLADLIFASRARPLGHATAGWPLIWSEILATAGLMVVVFGCARSGKTDTGPFAVGAWLMAAIVATPSNSYANPAIALAALVADGPIALSGSTASLYVAAEVAGALMAFAIIAVAYPRSGIASAASCAITAAEPSP